jgi:hypothetical protein
MRVVSPRQELLIQSQKARPLLDHPLEQVFLWQVWRPLFARPACDRLRATPGVCKQDKATNLLDRLEDFDLCVLAFLIDPNVPFTNNTGEQDICLSRKPEV